MKIIEKISVIIHNDELLFLDNSSGKKFDSITVFMFCPEKEMRDSDHTVTINLIRNNNLIDSGEYRYKDRDEKEFFLDKIIPLFWKEIGISSTSSIELIPKMFLEKDLLEIVHNSRESVSSSLVAFDPSYQDLKNQGLPFEEILEKMEHGIEIFPDVYRSHIYKF